jgi:catalase (peroxidase I)
MSEELIQQITLDCLVNKDIYTKMQNTNKTRNINKREKKFYRKRILNLSKDLLLKKDNDYDEINPDIKNSFDNFIKTCIHYFKIIDRNDILQEDYIDYQDFNLLNDTLNSNNDESSNLINESIDNNTITEKDNRLFMRSIKIKNGLENFVKITSTIKKDEIILPKIKEINLQDPNLRIKGIQKKENIRIKYDETKIHNEKQNQNQKKNNEI